MEIKTNSEQKNLSLANRNLNLFATNYDTPPYVSINFFQVNTIDNNIKCFASISFEKNSLLFHTVRLIATENIKSTENISNITHRKKICIFNNRKCFNIFQLTETYQKRLICGIL